LSPAKWNRFVEAAGALQGLIDRRQTSVSKTKSEPGVRPTDEELRALSTEELNRRFPTTISLGGWGDAKEEAIREHENNELCLMLRQSALRLPDLLRKWWRQWPDANIGALPAAFGCLVADVDGPDGELAAERLGLLAEPTLEVVTGRGRHLHILAPGRHDRECRPRSQPRHPG
jgi:hypothetical protein